MPAIQELTWDRHFATVPNGSLDPNAIININLPFTKRLNLNDCDGGYRILTAYLVQVSVNCWIKHGAKTYFTPWHQVWLNSAPAAPESVIGRRLFRLGQVWKGDSKLGDYECVLAYSVHWNETFRTWFPHFTRCVPHFAKYPYPLFVVCRCLSV